MKELENYWAIGDVHGCIFTLEKLVNKLPKESKLIFVGDLIDRGNYSKEVIEFVMQNNYKCVLGNHEASWIDYARSALRNGWKLPYSHDGGNKNTLLKNIKFIEKLPKYLEFEKYFITHGFGLPYYNRRDKPNEDLYTNRFEDIQLDWEKGWENYKIINIFGHTPYDEVLFGDNYIGVDTGAVFGNKLSAVNLLTKEVVSQDSVKMDIE